MSLLLRGSAIDSDPLLPLDRMRCNSLKLLEFSSFYQVLEINQWW